MKRIILIILICLLLPMNVFAVTYAKVGADTNFNGDVNIPSGFGYYINGSPLSSGEANTASNIGEQVEIFKQKTAEDLEFRTLKANSDKITISTVPVGSEIDVGIAATDRGNQTNIGDTNINKGNPANQTGTITSVEIWANTNLTGVIVATFYLVSGNNLTARDSQALENITAGSKVVRSVSLNVQAGDYIGVYSTAGRVEMDTSGGSGWWYLPGDQTSCTNTTFNLEGTWCFSLYATGATSPLDYIKFDIDPTKITELIPSTLSLLSTTIVSFAADADTTLYTVPAGKRCILTHAIIVAAGDAGATTTVSIGKDTAETDFVPANTLSNLDAQYDSVILMPIPNVIPLKIKSYAATTVIQAQVASQSGAAGNTVYLFGILY